MLFINIFYSAKRGTGGDVIALFLGKWAHEKCILGKNTDQMRGKWRFGLLNCRQSSTFSRKKQVRGGEKRHFYHFSIAKMRKKTQITTYNIIFDGPNATITPFWSVKTLFWGEKGQPKRKKDPLARVLFRTL